ncbi:DUF4232 domain-containing protein [Streptomyces sp. NPDC086787]|uniref:DUF4232 domain-containing protein n=1 Tax=Streptomyces sp. NPDC086787 TaxID=3365759 RepID=UPI0037F491F8
MRAITLTVTAVAAALALTACDDGGGGGTGGDKSTNSSACRIGEVSVQIGSASMAPAAGDSGEVPVSITNQSAACTLDGFAGVELRADGTSEKVPALEGATGQKLKLAKGDSASFTISYVRGKDGDTAGLAAQSVKIGLPGSGTSQSFPWKYGPIAAKGGGSGPDASVSGFQQAGD